MESKLSFLYRFNKPEYFFNPTQLIRRFKNKKLNQSVMPWGSILHYNPNEDIGRAINVLGIYELPLTELIYRSLKNVDHFVDVGANIGYFSSLARSMSTIKTVTSFEPHPVIFEYLSKNAKETAKEINLIQLAASEVESEAELYIPANFEENMGTASLEKSNESEDKIIIKTKPLDEMISPDLSYCIKIDTEGHEASVLKGAINLLKNKSARYIFFEEFKEYPKAETFKILKEHNYKVFRIERSFSGPKLVSPEKEIITRQWQPVNFLAIDENDNSLDQLRKSGWSILSL
jgi:FkbM family methyltransferase